MTFHFRFLKFTYRPEPRPMIIHPGKQYRPRGRAGRKHMKVGQLQAFFRQIVQARGFDPVAKSTDDGISQFAGDDEQDVGQSVFRFSEPEPDRR